MDKVVRQLRQDYPHLSFKVDGSFCWSPAKRLITYREDSGESSLLVWSILHELSHAVLEHNRYETDLELLLMETAAWDKAKELAKKYGYSIDDNHIQDCLDTYRDWLDQRSTCPMCGNTGLQHSPRKYHCFNCQASWEVSPSRFCRPYRQISRQKKTPPGVKTRAVFR